MTTALDAIRELRDLLAKGSAEPWRVHRSAVSTDGGVRLQGRWLEVPPLFGVSDPFGGNYPSDCPVGMRGEDNAALIVAMHRALPALLDVAEAAEEMRKALASPVGGLRREMLLGAAKMQLDDALSSISRGKEGGQ